MFNSSQYIYLDNAATSFPKPTNVVDAYVDALTNFGVSPGRSGHPLAVMVGRAYYNARENISDFFGCEDPLRMIFTKNVTEALNIAILGLSLNDGDQVLTSCMEHNSIARVLNSLKSKGVIITKISSGESPDDFLDRLTKAINPKVKLIVLTHASNVTGQVFPIRQVGALARDKGITFLVDAAQSAGHLEINVEKDFIDLLAFTGHKGLMGPPGTGGLYIGENVTIKPSHFGGTGSFSENDVQPDFLPDALESGTPNTPGIIALSAGVDFVKKIGIANIREKEQSLLNDLREGLTLSKVTHHMPPDAWQTTSIVSISIDGYSCSQAAQILGESNICTRPGLHCAPWAHIELGTFPNGTLRISPNHLNTKEDINIIINAIKKMI